MQNKYDDVLKSGLSELKRTEFSRVPQEEKINHDFSEAYIKGKNYAIQNTEQVERKSTKTVIKKIAVIVVTLLFATSSLMSVDAVRNNVSNFIFHVYNSFTEIKQDKETDKEKIVSKYTLSNLPDGYYVASTDANSLSFITFYTNKNSESIVLNQMVTSVSKNFNSEQGELSEVKINDTNCLICKKDSNYFCYWDFDGYRFELIYPMELGEKYMAEVVGKLVEVEK